MMRPGSTPSAQSLPRASLAPDLKTQTRFMGYQVGSDLGMFNIQNTGWNLHRRNHGWPLYRLDRRAQLRRLILKLHCALLRALRRRNRAWLFRGRAASTRLLAGKRIQFYRWINWRANERQRQCGDRRSGIYVSLPGWGVQRSLRYALAWIFVYKREFPAVGPASGQHRSADPECRCNCFGPGTTRRDAWRHVRDAILGSNTQC